MRTNKQTNKQTTYSPIILQVYLNNYKQNVQSYLNKTVHFKYESANTNYKLRYCDFCFLILIAIHQYLRIDGCINLTIKCLKQETKKDTYSQTFSLTALSVQCRL